MEAGNLEEDNCLSQTFDHLFIVPCCIIIVPIFSIIKECTMTLFELFSFIQWVYQFVLHLCFYFELLSVFSTIRLETAMVNLKWYGGNGKAVVKEEENYEIFDLSGSQFYILSLMENKWTFLPLTFHFKVNYCYIFSIISFSSDPFFS